MEEDEPEGTSARIKQGAVLIAYLLVVYFTCNIRLIGMNGVNANVLCFGCAHVRVVFFVVCVETINNLLFVFFRRIQFF